MKPEDVPEELHEAVLQAYFARLEVSMAATPDGVLDIPSRADVSIIIAAVAPLIAAREREACAQISFDEYLAASHDDEDPQNHDLVARFRSQGGADSANRIYAAIRARGGEG